MKAKLLIPILLSSLLLGPGVFALEENTSKCNLEDIGNSEKFEPLVLIYATQKNLTDEMKLFLHFERELNNDEIQGIEQLGTTIYKDSWIPPVGIHPTGFYLAKSKVENICKLANLDSVKRISSGEGLQEPQSFPPPTDLEEAPPIGKIEKPHPKLDTSVDELAKAGNYANYINLYRPDTVNLLRKAGLTTEQAIELIKNDAFFDYLINYINANFPKAVKILQEQGLTVEEAVKQYAFGYIFGLDPSIFEIKNNQVGVEIGLTNSNFKLSSEFGTEKGRLGGENYLILGASVYLNKIFDLVENPDIKYVQLPSRLRALEETPTAIKNIFQALTGKEKETAPKNLVFYYLGIGAVIILILLFGYYLLKKRIKIKYKN